MIRHFLLCEFLSAEGAHAHFSFLHSVKSVWAVAVSFGQQQLRHKNRDRTAHIITNKEIHLSFTFL